MLVSWDTRNTIWKSSFNTTGLYLFDCRSLCFCHSFRRICFLHPEENKYPFLPLNSDGYIPVKDNPYHFKKIIIEPHNSNKTWKMQNRVTIMHLVFCMKKNILHQQLLFPVRKMCVTVPKMA